VSAPLLCLDKVSKRFGGLVAVDGVTFELPHGGVTGIIGPNGAGKTTLFSLIAGSERASSGRVAFDGRDVTKLAAHGRARLGVGRTFQITQAFAGLSVRENVAVGAYLRHPRREDALARAAEVAELVGLGDRLDVAAASLTLSARKRLEVARALATEPKLLLLDECFAGLNPSEARGFSSVISDIAAHGVTVLMIEHVMQTVMSLCGHVHVLAEGRLIAQGTPGEVTRDSRVIEAYLGRGAAARLDPRAAHV
jgi:branched-chain amino acid transport system ATP-binding protein